MVLVLNGNSVQLTSRIAGSAHLGLTAGMCTYLTFPVTIDRHPVACAGRLKDVALRRQTRVMREVAIGTAGERP
jgi:hypothetical protein